jgi:hypothetical protein
MYAGGDMRRFVVEHPKVRHNRHSMPIPLHRCSVVLALGILAQGCQPCSLQKCVSVFNIPPALLLFPCT